jgi:hypothetical protein
MRMNINDGHSAGPFSDGGVVIQNIGRGDGQNRASGGMQAVVGPVFFF